MLTFAQFERELASERIRDKIHQKVQRGLYPGGRPPLGYRVVNKSLVVDAPAATVARRIFETYAETRSLARAHEVVLNSGLLSKKGAAYGNSMVWHLLQNPVLTGKIVHKGKIFPGHHQPVISPELFDHVQTILKSRPRPARHPYPNMPYAGLIKCEECGSIMSASHVVKKTPQGGRRYYYYRCSRLTHRGWKSCSTRQINADRLHATVEKILTERAADTDYLKNVFFASTSCFRSGETTGAEPRSLTGGYSMENLQKSLRNFTSMCARKTGIEKALLVQAGIQKVHYSKDSVGVDFRWERFLDGPDAPPAPAAALRAAAETKKGPNPFSGLEPSSWMWPVVSATLQRVSPAEPPPTAHIRGPNFSHHYWNVYHSKKGAVTV